MAFSQGRKFLEALAKLNKEKIKNPPVASVSSLQTQTQTCQVFKQSKNPKDIRTQQDDAVSIVSEFTPDELSILNADWVEKNEDKNLPQASSSSAEVSLPQILKVKQWLFRDDSADGRDQNVAFKSNAKCTSVDPKLSEVVECSEGETSNNDRTPEGGLITPDQVTHHDQLAAGHNVADNTVTPEDSVEMKSQQGSKVKKALFPEIMTDGSGNVDTRNTYAPEVHALTEDILAAGINPLESILVLPLDGPEESEVVIDNNSVHADSNSTDVNCNVLQLNEVENVVIETEEYILVESETSPGHNQDENGNNVKKRKRQDPPDDKTPPKKRKVVQAKWKATIAKEAYNSGIAHVTLRGKERPARSMKPGCADTCKRGCMHKIAEQSRQIQFQKYWNSKNKSAQWLMLAKLVTVLPVKRRRGMADDADEFHRKHSYEYHLPDENSVNIPVCQTTFLHTFDISIKTVRSALLKNSPDKRGKHGSRKNKLSEALVDSVKTHIKRFPVVESHYCRVDTRRKYLDEDLSVAKMHRLYLMQHDKSDPNTATLRQYRDIFNTYFNLGFFKPKKDQCSVCSQWNGLNEEEKLANLEKSVEIDEHLKNKKIVRELKRQDKADSRDEEKNPNLNKVRVITFDLQKVFLTPRSDVGEFFYKRKLSSYNFTVFDCTTKEAHCYCWDQTIGDRGANEIASCIYMYIMFLVSKGVLEIFIYSDSCSAQNKNQFLYSMYYWISIKHNVKIIHRYLEKGHTQMEADNVHARIEKKVKNKDLYVPQQWYGLIRCARVKKPHYVVKEVTQNDILNMKELGEYFQWSKLPISKIREIVYDVNFPRGHISFKKNLESESTVVNVLKNKPGRPVNWVTLRPPKPIYTEKRPMKKKLKDDLEWFVKKNYIPAPYVERFRALFEYESHEEVEEEESNVDMPQEVTPEPDALLALGENNEDEPDVPEDAECPPAADCSTDSEAYD